LRTAKHGWNGWADSGPRCHACSMRPWSPSAASALPTTPSS
jgi:hypothetical protein